LSFAASIKAYIAERADRPHRIWQTDSSCAYGDVTQAAFGWIVVKAEARPSSKQRVRPKLPMPHQSALI
jgi:hypothetical protein